MKLFKLLLALSLPVSIGSTHAITISGTVRDTLGKGISGASVNLEKAAISTTTSQDGSFTLHSESTALAQPGRKSILSPRNTVYLDNNILKISFGEAATATVVIYDCNGRIAASAKVSVSPGNHASFYPRLSKGLHIYCVSLNGEKFLLMGAQAGIAADKKLSAHCTETTFKKQTAATADFKDIIGVKADGYLNYRGMATNPDTSGIVITLLPSAGDVKDIDGNIYQTVRIGRQIWTTSNLKTTKYRNGLAIQQMYDRFFWFNQTSGAYCYDTDPTTTSAKDGLLYNWYAVSANPIGPLGWSVPDNADWDTLENYLITNGYNFDGSKTDNKVAKSLASNAYWPPSNTVGNPGNNPAANNRSGFSGLPSGCRSKDSDFFSPGTCYWWSTTESISGTSGYIRRLAFSSPDLQSTFLPKNYGCSVRLVRYK